MGEGEGGYSFSKHCHRRNYILQLKRRQLRELFCSFIHLAIRQSPGEIKSREMEMGCHSWVDCLAASRDQERSRAGRWRWAVLQPDINKDIKPHIIMGSHSWMDCLTAELFLGNCFSDIVFVTLFRTAVETAIRGVHKLLGTGGVPASLTLLFWRWLTMSSVFTGRRARTSYS